MSEANEVLDRISRDVRDILRLMRDSDGNINQCLNKLDMCCRQLHAVVDYIPRDKYNAVVNCLQQLKNELERPGSSHTQHSQQSCSYEADRPLSGMFMSVSLKTDSPTVRQHTDITASLLACCWLLCSLMGIPFNERSVVSRQCPTI